MLLFLDVVSPLPEFSVIEDKNLILKTKIIKNFNDKISDNIIQAYKRIDKNLNLTKNLSKVSLTIGPGSYTGLRVGASFISALHISKNIPFYPFTIKDILDFNSTNYNKKNIGIFVISSNNQNFFCKFNEIGEVDYSKIEENKFNIPKHIDTIFYNYKKFKTNNNFKQIKFSFVDEIIKNYDMIKFRKKETIKPIFISNNNILN